MAHLPQHELLSDIEPYIRCLLRHGESDMRPILSHFYRHYDRTYYSIGMGAVVAECSATPERPFLD